MDFTISVKMDPFGDWEKRLRQDDFSVPLDMSATIALSEVATNFAMQGRPAWQALAPSTIAGRRARGKGARILEDSGTLMRSWQKGDQNAVYEADPHHVAIGTNLPYAGFQEYGTHPYEIRPRVKKALYWPGAAHPVQLVRHPGLVARPSGFVTGKGVDDMVRSFTAWLFQN